MDEGYNDNFEYSYYRHNSLNHVNPMMRIRNKRIIHLLTEREALKLTIRRLKSYVLIKQKIVVEADCEVSDMMDNKDTIVHENFEDIAGASVEHTSYGNPDTLRTGQYNLLNMSDFLARPLKLSQAVVPLDSDFTFELDVWDEFTSHPSVRAKLRNYAYLNGTLNLRITVSGTPWHFGKLQVSYQPLAGHNRNLEYLEPQLVTARRYLALTYLSQAKGATVIDVHDNKPLEIECPFISPQPMLRLFNKSPLILAAAGSYDDMVGFGKLYINSISPIRAINATSTEIGVQIYAWMTNVELGTPTGTVIEIGTEGSYETLDERKTGPVEKITTSAGNIASMLTNVPYIGPFARAAIKPLSLMSKISSILGFSYPVMVEKPLRVRSEPFQNGSNCIGYDTGHRLTVDPLQELSVDPRATGTDQDEMSYSSIARVETLIDTFTWSSSDGQLAGSIWMAPVNPNVSKRHLVSVGNYYVAPTALGFVAAPHQWWRGDITFRFEVVCSKFHRGTLAVVYEPNISQNVVIDTALDLNKQYIKKIDLQSVTDFEITVKWAYPRPWAKVLTPDLFGDLGTVAFLGDALFEYANGYIAVVPYTELQSPDGSDITINVYIRSENMNFNQFTMENVPTTRPIVEASYEEIGTPNIVDSSPINESTASEDNITVFNFGEMPTSFRLMIKRFMGMYNPDSLIVTSAAAGNMTIRLVGQNWTPPTPSYETYSYTYPNLIGYLRYAYLGMRGGMRIRVSLLYLDTTSMPRTTPLIVENGLPSESYGAPTLAVIGPGYSTMVNKAYGSTTFVPDTNAGIEFEVPMYTPDLFLMSFKEDPLEVSSIVTSDISSMYKLYTYRQIISPTANQPVVAGVSSAAADDFSFMRYSGAPIYSYTS